MNEEQNPARPQSGPETASGGAANGPTSLRARMLRTLARYAFVPILAALILVILHGGFGLGRDTTPRIHDLRNPDACSECHPAGAHDQLTQTEPELCYRCHLEALSHGESHPINIPVTTNTDPQIPLFDGQMNCSTCHDAHGKVGNRLLLRRTGNALCLACHKDHGTGVHGGSGKAGKGATRTR